MKLQKLKTHAAILLWIVAFTVSVVGVEYKWPDRGKDPYPWPQGKDAKTILRDRFEQASKKSLGTEKDAEEIKNSAFAHMKISKASVNEIRWLSPTLVMAHTSWYSSPDAAASYFYILEKRNRKWEVLTYYLLVIS